MLRIPPKFMILVIASITQSQVAFAQVGNTNEVQVSFGDNDIHGGNEYSQEMNQPSNQPMSQPLDTNVHESLDWGASGCCNQNGCRGRCGSNDIWTRKTLTGDWGGRRTALQESGITFAGRSTHFGFGVNGGINVPPVPVLGAGDTFKYTGRGEYDLLFNLEKFGGLPKGSLLVRAEHWYGEYGNVSLNTGAFPPAVFPATTPPAPNDAGTPYITNFVVTQPLSEKLVVFAGKKDVLGSVDQDEFAGGDGTDQFVNQALIANPAFLLGMPYTSFTMGAVMPNEWGTITTFIYDPQDRTTDFFNFGDLFSQGIILGSEVKLRTNFLGMKGSQHIGALWKHVEQTDLSFAEPPPGVYPQPVEPGFPTLSDSYTIYYGFDQYLVQYGDEQNRGWGLFGRASISDGNPTPLRYFLSTGIGGFSPVGRHRGDTFGIGGYYVGASNEFGPLPQAIFGPRDLRATRWSRCRAIL